MGADPKMKGMSPSPAISLLHGPAGDLIRCENRNLVPNPLCLWHLASLDAPTVAVVWSLGFARAAGVDLPLWILVSIALGTWSVYVGDRLLDVHSALHSANFSGLRERHYFHWRHRRVLLPLAIAAAAVAAGMIFVLMPVRIREHDSFLAAAALAYFSRVHSPRLQTERPFSFPSKEFLVGVLFTLGCGLPTLSMLHFTGAIHSRNWPLLVAIAFFATLAWGNCRAIELWESGSISRIVATLNILGIIGLLGAIAYVATPPVSAIFAAGSASALLLAVLGCSRRRLAPIAVRSAADLVLLTPLFLLVR